MPRATPIDHPMNTDAGARCPHARLAALLHYASGWQTTPEQTLGKDSMRMLERAELLLRNQVELLAGYGPQDLGESFDWFHTPRGDLQWPTHLSRHYWLMPLALTYRVTGDERYAGKVVEVLLDWVHRFPIGVQTLDRGRAEWTNPPAAPNVYEMFFKGYCDGPWTSLSAHARFDAWCRLLPLIAGSAALSESAVERLLRSLFDDHVPIMIDFPRRMNQFQAIARSLVTCGWYFPDEPISARAEQVGWERLLKWSQEQIYPDGSVAECSPNYGVSCVRGLREVIRQAETAGRSVDPRLHAAVARGARYYAMTIDPTGRSPRLAKGGQEIAHTLETLGQPVPPEEGKAPLSAVFPWVGHAVARSGWDADAAWCFFDMGPRGSGHHDIAHLALQLTVAGHRLLVDPGYYSYSTDGEDGKMARYLKTSPAHNTGAVDGQGQIAFPSRELWGPNVAPGDYPHTDDGNVFRVSAAYSHGYGQDGRVGVVHRRAIAFDRLARTLTTEDHFQGNGSHRCDLHWHLAPNAQPAVTGNRIDIMTGRVSWSLTTHCQHPVSIELIRGRHEPLLGWFSERYGHLEPTTTAVISTNASLPLVMQTTIRWTTTTGHHL